MLSKATSGRLSERVHAYHITVKEALKNMPKAIVLSFENEVTLECRNGTSMHSVCMSSRILRQTSGIKSVTAFPWYVVDGYALILVGGDQSSGDEESKSVDSFHMCWKSRTLV